MKFPVSDLASIATKLAALGGEASGPETETDVYFNHPARDFARTDEALRVRRRGDACFLTYKGPKIDAATKTRREIDLPLPPGPSTAQQWTSLFEALGFKIAGTVEKSRRKMYVNWQHRRVEASLDQIERLGSFVELELVVESDELDAARTCIAALADHLGLRVSERRSYLELLRQDQPGAGST
ncbi:MAG: class IV adenylate cyclase [Planctomycetaceae bacterium]|nr:class IV adenylate cyclase [Planctomycetaceae bacterium]